MVLFKLAILLCIGRGSLNRLLHLCVQALNLVFQLSNNILLLGNCLSETFRRRERNLSHLMLHAVRHRCLEITWPDDKQTGSDSAKKMNKTTYPQISFETLTHSPPILPPLLLPVFPSTDSPPYAGDGSESANAHCGYGFHSEEAPE